MSTTIQQIGKRLCARRNQMNLTQEQLAERANVTAQTISYAELGKKAMRADTIIGVCNALKISADYLLFGEMAPKDFSALEQKLSQLSPGQYRCIENVIDNFITALNVGTE